MEFKHIEAFARRTNAGLVGQISSFLIGNLTKTEVESYSQYAEQQKNVVVLPLEYSIEQYKDKNSKIASFCICIESKIEKDKSGKENSIKFRCECKNRCFIKNIEIENGKVFVDLDTIENQQFNRDLLDIKLEILSNFKEYLKWDDISIKDIERIKNASDVESFINKIERSCKMNLDVRRKLLEELEPSKRLDILNSELVTRIFEVSSEKSKDLFEYYKSKINKINMPVKNKKKMYEELTRLKVFKVGAAEYSNIIDWLDRSLMLPWDTMTEDNTDLEDAREILNKSHYGMDKLKEKVFEYISVNMINKKAKTPILCLYGPPGVGKTSICKAIGKALNKNVFSMSLASVTQPEDLIGMKRFYIGSKPGRVMEGLIENNSKNGIIVFDEIDKMGKESLRGNPYGSLLEILDKNQNKEFKDKYFDFAFDISNTMFIATANSLEPIPDPVLNRMELIYIDGYSLYEKTVIAKNFILPKILKEYGLDDQILTIPESLLKHIIEDYTYESGVRELERVLEDICRKHLIYLANNGLSIEKYELTEDRLYEYIEKPIVYKDNLARENECGVVNLLSVSQHSGNVGRMEVSIVKGNGEIEISDNIVGSAKGTIKTCFGLIRSRAEKWGIDESFFEKNDFYVHFTHHAIRVDGPSAGIGNVMCILSAIKNKPINPKIAFTGEISLRGEVFAIGGLKEKLLAVQRNKLTTVIIPFENKLEADRLPNENVEGLNIIYVKNIDEVYDVIFGE